MEKERHIQFQMVCALSDTDQIRKLLAMKIKATTAEMLAVCCTYIAIVDNMSFNGPINKSHKCSTEDDEEVINAAPHVATAQNATLQADSTAQQRILPATLARRLVTGSRSAGSLTRPRMPTRNPSHNLNADMEEEEGQMR